MNALLPSRLSIALLLTGYCRPMPRNEQSSSRPGRPALSARIGPLLLLAAIVLAAIAGITFALDRPGLAWSALALAAVLAVLGAALVARNRPAA